MRIQNLAAAAWVFGILGLAGVAAAQESAEPARDKSVIDRLDDLGKSIFGEILPLEKTKTKEAAKGPSRSYSSKPNVVEMSDEIGMPPDDGRRAGSILAGPPATGRAARGDRPTDAESIAIVERASPPASNAPEQTPKRVRRSPAPLFEDLGPIAGPSEQKHSPTASLHATIVPKAAATQNTPVEKPETNANPARPLHERMSAFRQSAFGKAAVANSEPSAADAYETPPNPTRTAEATPPQRSSSPTPSQRLALHVEAGRSEADEPVLQPSAAAPVVSDAPAEVEASDDGLLMTRKGPVLSVETLGPRRISVGKESVYEVNIINAGEVAAEDMVVYVALPEWAEVVGVQASSGAAQPRAQAATSGALQWNLGHLDARGRERLTLRIVPRQSRPFDLAVRWEYKPVASQASIEVQEPKLALQLEGPREVLYGKKELYRLRLLNVGNGAAENVALMLMPLGGGDNVPATHKIGLLAAGDEKALDVELTARQAGELSIHVDARADGGIHAELAEKVLVRRAALKIDIEGPRMQYVGATAAYNIRLSNPGTAPARNLTVSAVLPAGAKYVSGIENARVDASGGKLEWTIDALNPEVELRFALKCSLGAPGVGRVQISASADDDLAASSNAVTRVDAVANLVMEVKNPEGPVAVGDEAEFEVRLSNRGAREAAGVEVFAYFSRGIEPTAAEGAPNRVGPGQVTFLPISSLAPGAEAVLKVRARAEVAGTHVFRAEAHCKPLSARLVSEATNLYYADAPVAESAPGTSAGEAAPANAMRPVTRPALRDMPPMLPRK